MKYSKYFKGVLHNDGLPQLKTTGRARMMNIAALEYGISKLQKVRKLNQNSPEPYKYDLMILKEKELLSGLTQDLPPNDLNFNIYYCTNEILFIIFICNY